VAKAKQKSGRNVWTASDLKTLKTMSKIDTARAAAKVLGRTPSAVQQKASSAGISFTKKTARKKK
jgi:hypothetical protein